MNTLEKLSLRQVGELLVQRGAFDKLSISCSVENPHFNSKRISACLLAVRQSKAILARSAKQRPITKGASASEILLGRKHPFL
jgi:hypothetical protein